jgi:hypothetical protein
MAALLIAVPKSMLQGLDLVFGRFWERLRHLAPARLSSQSDMPGIARSSTVRRSGLAHDR